METHTIDELLSDLSDRINFANPEKFRGDVLRFMRRVMVKKIGLELVGYPFKEAIEVINHKLVTPSYLLKLEDLSFDGEIWAGFQVGNDMQPGGSLCFQSTPFGYRLPNLSRGCVYAKGIGLPRNEAGDTLIPDAVYDGLLKFCLGELLEGQYQHPMYPRINVVKAEAMAMIQEAIAELNQESHAGNRTQRHATGHLRVIDNSLFWNS